MNLCRRKTLSTQTREQLRSRSLGYLGRVVPILIQQWADFRLNPSSEPRTTVGDRSVGVWGYIRVPIRN